MHCLTSLKFVAELWCHPGTFSATCICLLILECSTLFKVLFCKILLRINHLEINSVNGGPLLFTLVIIFESISCCTCQLINLQNRSQQKTKLARNVTQPSECWCNAAQVSLFETILANNVDLNLRLRVRASLTRMIQFLGHRSRRSRLHSEVYLPPSVR